MKQKLFYLRRTTSPPGSTLKGLLRTIFILCMMIFLAVPQVLAEDKDKNSIDPSDITFSNHLNDGGYIEVRLPVFEAKNDNEMPDNGSYIKLNGTEIMRFTAYHDEEKKHQGDDDWAWAKAWRTSNLASIETYGTWGSYDQKWYTVGTSSTYCEYKKIDGGGSSYMWATYRIYPSVELLKSSSTMQVYVFMHVNVDGAEDHDAKNESDPYTFNPPQNITLNWSYSSNNPGYQEVSFSGTAGDTYSINSGSVNNITTTGSIVEQYAVQNQPRTVNVRYNKTLSKFQKYPLDASIVVPAYQHPNDFKAVMNNEGNVVLTWSIPDVSGDVVSGDEFEIQRSDDPQFATASSVGVIPFAGATNYTLIDKTSELNLNGDYYYRLRRNKASQWLWLYTRTTNLELEINHKLIKSVTAQMDEDDKVKISWTYDEGVVWSDNTSVMLVRNNVDRGVSLSYAIPTAEIKEEGNGVFSYTEELPTTCEEYTYKIYVKPGNTVYPAQEGLMVNSSEPLYTQTLGEILTTTASKGYYSDFVELKWTTDGNPVDMFAISSRIYGSNSDFEQLEQVEGNGAITSYQYSDRKSVPGVIYEYRISSVAQCGPGKVVLDGPTDIGFRTPTGDIYGRITFENGQAVQGVEVRAEATDGSGITGSNFHFEAGNTLTVDNTALLKEDTEAVTLQAWTTCNDGTVLKKEGMYAVAVKNGKATFTAGTQELVSETELTSLLNDQEQFVQVTAAMSADSLYIYLNGELDAQAARTATITGNDNPVIIGGDGFAGNIDEVRLWGRCLDATIIARDYGRYLVGNESDLRALYTFDYGCDKLFFDMSYTGSTYHANHGTVNGATADKVNVPTLDQLCYKSYTDTDGTYQLRALPYVGNGTTYMIIPRMGIHSFASEKELRLINGDAQNHTVNFTDKSSFLVQGYVRYEGGTVPVEGVQFIIDGITAMDNKGRVIMTDVTGEFAINVPVGTHEVRAIKQDHTFVNEGRITNSDGTDRNYQDMVTGIELWDNTKVRYIGRLAGGTVEEAKPIGHSVSKNNLGEGIKVTLTYMNGAYSMTENERTDTYNHLLPSNKAGMAPNTNDVNFKDNVITIYPNLTTGEFVADLIPEKYDVKVIAPGYENNVSSLGGLLDLSSSFVMENEPYNYTDSIISKGEKVYIAYSDTTYFNKKQIFSVRVSPSIEIVQLDRSGAKALPYFGNDTIPVGTSNGDVKMAAYNENDGSYLLGRPVFRQNDTYNFRARVFEGYNYYDASGNVMAGKEMDAVPCEGVIFEYTATMQSPSPVSVEADAEGVAHFSVTCDEPNLTTATATLSAKAKVGENGTSFDWVDPAGLMKDHIVMGSHLTGNNFVTAGPDRVLTVLRDPPGSHSYSYLEKGTSFTTTKTYNGAEYFNGSQLWTKHSGLQTITFTGVGAGTISKVEAVTGFTVGVEESENITGSETTESVITTTTRFQTSDDPLYVGSNGDVYVGHSTNIIFGDSRNVAIISREAYQNLQAEQSDFYSIYESITPATSEYILIQHKAIGTSDRFGTLFAYPQVYIEQDLIPNLEMIKKSVLRAKTEKTPEQFQAEANQSGEPIYVSHLDADDPDFGKSNTDKSFKEKLMEDAFAGPSYRVYIPEQIEFTTDTILYLNQAIDGWKKQIALNEEAKVKAKLKQNYSFHAGSPVEYTEAYSHSSISVQSFEISVGAAYTDDFFGKTNGVGVTFNLETHLGTTQGGEFTDVDEYNHTKGFVLADESNSTDYFSVDVCTEPSFDEDGRHDESKDDTYSSFIFRTRGGASSGPYEGEERTKYYEPGAHILNEATVQIEVPSITVEKDFIENVPSGESAYFTLYLMNNSEINADCYFTLFAIDGTNPNGAKLYLDGMPLGNGRNILVPAGQILQKTLEVSKGSVMNYDNLQLCLASQLQYDPTDFHDDIADTATISVHFTPSATPVNVKKPADNFTYNTKLPTKMVNGVEKYFQEVLLDGFDVNYDNFHSIRLQYKPTSNTDEQWVTLMNYYNDQVLYEGAVSRGELAELIKAEDKGVIRYEWTIEEPDQLYDLRAVGVSLVNNEMIENISAVHSGIKDMYNPRLFGSAQPANGILSIMDEIRLNFNEEIAAGYLTVNNFSVEGIRNGAQSDHSVSLRLDGENDVLTSEFSRNWSNKDFTIEMWVMPDASADAVLFSHGVPGNSLELGLTADNRLKVKVGNQEVVSEDAVAYEQGNWAHVALVYDRTGKVTAYYNFVKYITEANVPRYTGEGTYQFGASVDGTKHFAGKMHNARIWDTIVSSGYLQVNSLTIYSGHETNLLAYYPMNEGKGDVAMDKSRGANLAIGGSEWALPEGRAAKFNGTDQYVRVFTGSTAVVDNQMDYTLEFWFRGEAGQANATLVASGRGDGQEYGGSLNLFSIGFEDGVLTFRNNGEVATVEGNYLDNNWHHFAVAVNRTAVRGQIFIDGALRSYFDAQNIGGLSSAYVYLGARGWTSDQDVTGVIVDNFFKGEIDDFRMWKLYKNESLVQNGNSVLLDGSEMGLMAYYPFEHYITWQGTQELQFTLKDMKVQSDPAIVVPDGEQFGTISVETAATAPVKDKGPVSKLLYDFVVNNDALIITLNEPWDRVEKTIVTFTVDGVRDVNGNEILSPITWSAYIDRNQLKWSESSVSIETKAFTENTFTVKAVNNGGSVQHFTMENAPAWLTVSPMSGTIDPASSIDVTFTIDEGLNIGNYDEVVYMRNDNDVSEPLAIEVIVRGERPDWNVNPADYQYSMSIVGKMRMNGLFSSDKDDLLAAFHEGICVGVVNNSYDKVNDMWYAFLTVYSNEKQTSDIEFRMWDASTGKVYAATPDEVIFFAADALYGDKAPVIFDGKELHFQDIALAEGWNWISFNLASADLQNVTAALVKGQWNGDDVVKSNLYFDAYSESTQRWQGTLSQNGGLDNEQLFFVKSHAPQVLSMMGTEIDASQAPLTVKGESWNYISYLPNENYTVTEALAGYDVSQGDIIKSQTQFAVYSGKTWVGNLTYMIPNQGYMLYRNVANTTTFCYPTTSGSLSSRSLIRSISAVEEEESFLNANYAENMGVIATAVEFCEGDKILAYVAEELRGVSEIVLDEEGNELSFISIAGNNNDNQVVFKLERDGEIVAESSTAVSYQSNSLRGTLSAPMVIDFSTPDGIVAYPNPFVTETAIMIPVAEDGRLDWAVYDMNGQVVFQQSEDVKAGVYRTTWDGCTGTGASCPRGSYLIVAKMEGETLSVQVIKK